MPIWLEATHYWDNNISAGVMWYKLITLSLSLVDDWTNNKISMAFFMPSRCPRSSWFYVPLHRWISLQKFLTTATLLASTWHKISSHLENSQVVPLRKHIKLSLLTNLVTGWSCESYVDNRLSCKYLFYGRAFKKLRLIRSVTWCWIWIHAHRT